MNICGQKIKKKLFLNKSYVKLGAAYRFSNELPFRWGCRLLVLILRQCKSDVISRSYNIYRCRCLLTVFVFLLHRVRVRAAQPSRKGVNIDKEWKIFNFQDCREALKINVVTIALYFWPEQRAGLNSC